MNLIRNKPRVRFAQVRFIIANLVGLLPILSPQKWPALISRLRCSEGFAAPMFLIAAMGVLLFGSHGFGLLAGNFAASILNYFALVSWLIVGVATCCTVGYDGARNLRRFGPLSISRPRWWFEFARIFWIGVLFIALSLLLLTFTFPQMPIHDGVFVAACVLYVVFVVSTTAGYIVSALSGRRRCGKAFECVQYFYYMFFVAALFVGLLILIPIRLAIAPPNVIIGIVVMACLLTAIILTLRNRRVNRLRKIV